MTPGIVQLHLTRRCNLRCLHCYSRSGPEHAQRLDLGRLVSMLEWAKGAGYWKLSLSGGEPFLYPELWELLEYAHGAGWAISAVSNGGPLTRETVERASRYLSLVGVSLDGTEELHNRIRCSPAAYRRALKAMEQLREADLPFMVVHSLSRSSLPDLCELLGLVREEGAVGLHLHPLEHLGYGSELREEGLSPEERTLAYLWVMERRGCLAQEGFQLDIDLVNAFRLPELFQERGGGAFGEVVSPLVVEPDGALVPFTFGLSRSWMLGADLSVDTLDEEPFRRSVAGLVGATIDRTAESEWPFVSWYEALADEARAHGPEAFA